MVGESLEEGRSGKAGGWEFTESSLQSLWSQLCRSSPWGGQQDTGLCSHNFWLHVQMPRERLQLDQAENIGDDAMWVNGNFAQFKLSGQKTRYERNGVRRTPDYIQYVYFKCPRPKNIAFLKHAIRQESEQLLSLVLSQRQTFSAKSLPWQEGPEEHEKLNAVQGSWSEERETKETKGIPPVNHT